MAVYPFVASGLIGVPVGTILAYVGPREDSLLGPSWTWCDGHVVDAPGSPVHGLRTPQLNDERLLIGVDQDASVTQAIGSNSWDNDGSHEHEGGTTGIHIGGHHPDEAFEHQGNHTANHSHTVRVGGGAHSHGEKLPRRLGVRFIMRVL